MLLSKAKLLYCFADAYETAKMLCEQYYLVAPELEVEEFNGKRKIIFTVHTRKLTKSLMIPELYCSEISSHYTAFSSFFSFSSFSVFGLLGIIG